MNTDKRIKPNIILLDGISGVGKSMILDFLKSKYKNKIFVGTKLTNRKRRESDNNWEFEFVENIPSNYELSFPSVGNLYAINNQEIERKITDGFTYVISCTDRTTIQKVQSRYKTIVIYIYRNFTIDDFSNLVLKKDTKSYTAIKNRTQEFADLSSGYLENIDLYDHVILNINSIENALKQLSKILSLYGFSKIKN
jgi:guanylate kinase